MILGPYLSGALLADHSRPPTVRELVSLKSAVERHGPGITALLTSLPEASSRSPAVRIEIQLDRLLEFYPSLWTHPSQVQDRPIPDVVELLEACRLRMEVTAGEGEKERLGGVEEKLARAVRIEDKARERRQRRGGKD